MHLEPGAFRNPWTDDDVARHWDAVADEYVPANERLHDTHVQRFERAVEWLDLAPGIRVLNVSSRDCEAEDFVRRTCPKAEIVHAEISRGLMDVAARLRPGADQRKIDSYSALPFADGEFDRVLSLETIEHVAEPTKFLRELYRVSRSHAVLVLSCPPATSEIPYQVYTFLFGGHGEGPHRFLSTRVVRTLLEASGWKLQFHLGTLLVPVGPRFLRRWGERVIEKYQDTFIAELGIRQFFVSRRA